jgi:hypothetical protein
MRKENPLYRLDDIGFIGTQEIPETERRRDVAATSEYFRVLKTGKSHKIALKAAIMIKNKDRHPRRKKSIPKVFSRLRMR